MKFITGVGIVIVMGIYIGGIVLLPLTLYFAVRDVYITATVVFLYAFWFSFFVVYSSKTINRRTFVKPWVAVALISMITTVFLLSWAMVNSSVGFIFNGWIDVLTDQVLGLLILLALASAGAATVAVYIVFFTHVLKPDYRPKNSGQVNTSLRPPDKPLAPTGVPASPKSPLPSLKARAAKKPLVTNRTEREQASVPILA